MPQIINTNLASLNAQRNLNGTQGALDTALQRLSSGLRINSAKDDAAGLAISNQFTSQIRGLNQAVRNANDGISVAQVAEGALGETTNLLQRVRELAIQSANATNGSTERNALQAEANQLVQEIDRIANTTRFGSRSILSGTFTNQAFQVGAQANESIRVSIASARSEDIGRINTVAFTGFDSSDVSAAAASPTSTIGSQTLTFDVEGVETSISVAAGESALSIGDKINASVGGLTATARTGVELTFGATNAVTDAVTLEINGISLGSVAAGLGADPAAQGAAVAAAIQANNALSGLTVTDNADGTINVYDSTGADITVGVTAATDTTVALEELDFADATFTTDTGTASGGSVTVGVAASAIVTGDLLFSTALGAGTATALFSSSGTAGITSSTTEAAGAGTVTEGSLRVSDIDISSVSGAQQALGLVDAAIQSIDSQRGDLGAIQNRLESTIANLQNVVENVSAARSRIQDADFAAETAALTKATILQNAGIAILAQANALPQQVLALLQ